MHPIERLRYVARSSGAGQGELVQETATALAAFGFDPPGLVTACRRVLQRHPLSGPLWWLASRVLTAGDPRREAWAVAEDIADDGTPTELARALPDEAVACVLGWPELTGEALTRRGDVEVRAVDVLGGGGGLARLLRRAEVVAVDVPAAGLGAAVAGSGIVLLEASALGPSGFVAVAGSRAAAAVARHAGVPVWVVAGVGRVLPAVLWEALLARIGECEPWAIEDEFVPPDLVTSVVGPFGLQPFAESLGRGGFAVAPELLRAAE